MLLPKKRKFITSMKRSSALIIIRDEDYFLEKMNPHLKIQDWSFIKTNPRLRSFTQANSFPNKLVYSSFVQFYEL